ncbi:MAG: deoxyribonuclease IV [Candidatus Aminicenantia bacterium]
MSVKLGAHLSIQGGIHRAIERGIELNCETVQFFIRNSNRWKEREIDEEEIEKFRELVKISKIYPLIGHAIYLINLSSPLDDLVRKSISALFEDVRKCDMLKIQYFIIHGGFHLGKGDREGIRRFCSSLGKVLKEHEEVEILIENSSGAGTQIGWKLEHLQEILEILKGGIGFCIDTCHLFSAGYQISNREGFEKTMEEINLRIGFDKVKVIHLNDSKRECGSKIDRHEHIGVGKIGEDGFRFFLNFEPFKFLPFIIETPKGRSEDGVDMDIVNLRKLRAFYKF